MARPIKLNADYFSHDAGMRNHRKIKSVRQKFGINGYGIWCMLIEYLMIALLPIFLCPQSIALSACCSNNK